MRSIIFVLAAGFLATLPACGGSLTGAQKEIERQNELFYAAKPQWNACYQRVMGAAKYTEATRNMRATLEGLSSTSKPTTKEIALLYDMYAELQPCQKIQMDAASGMHPLRVAVLAENFAERDKLWANAVSGTTTWGQFNQGRKENTASLEAKMAVAHTEIASGLHNQHANEIAQRQRANAAFQQWAYQQQALKKQQALINAVNQPRTYNCGYVGNTNQIQCSSL